MTPDWTSPDGSIRLYCADCLDVLPTLPTGAVDCVVTDPPYGVGYQYLSHDDSRDGYEDWCAVWFAESQRITDRMLMSCGQVNVPMWAAIRPFAWQIAWLKPAAMGRSPVGFCNWEPLLLWGEALQDSVDVFTAHILPDAVLDGHPCPKPEAWGIGAVNCASASKETVGDWFMGSGTTGVACVKLGRRFIGIEKEPAYFGIAVSRIEDALNDWALPTSPAMEQPDMVGAVP